MKIRTIALRVIGVPQSVTCSCVDPVSLVDFVSEAEGGILTFGQFGISFFSAQACTLEMSLIRGANSWSPDIGNAAKRLAGLSFALVFPFCMLVLWWILAIQKAMVLSSTIKACDQSFAQNHQDIRIFGPLSFRYLPSALFYRPSLRNAKLIVNFPLTLVASPVHTSVSVREPLFGSSVPNGLPCKISPFTLDHAASPWPQSSGTEECPPFSDETVAFGLYSHAVNPPAATTSSGCRHHFVESSFPMSTEQADSRRMTDAQCTPQDVNEDRESFYPILAIPSCRVDFIRVTPPQVDDIVTRFRSFALPYQYSQIIHTYINN